MRDLTLAMPVGLSAKRTKASVSKKVLNLSLLIAIVFFGILYLFEVNDLGTKGYQIRNLEQQVRQVEENQKNLQIQTSDLQSIDRIQQQAQILNFVPSTTITYLKDSDFALK
jgi:cell division protein FtsL